jgi:hypothetical protein
MSNWNLPPESQVDAEQKARMLLEPGLYSFEVIEAKSKTSKSGNPMIEMKVGVFPENPNAKPRVLFDYLMPSLAYKVLHFCRETGQPERYANGDLTADHCLGKSGVCYVRIKKDKEGKFPDKNEIGDYGAREKSSKPKSEGVGATSKPANDLADDDIPF